MQVITTTDLKELKFENNKEKQEFLKSSFQGMYKYADGTHSLVSEKDKLPKVGDYFLTYNQQLMEISKVLEVRDHKGVFENESKRQKISIVKGFIIVYSVITV